MTLAFFTLFFFLLSNPLPSTAARANDGRARPTIPKTTTTTTDSLNTYIIHVQRPPDTASISSILTADRREKWYRSFLPTSAASTTLTASTGKSRLVHSYKSVIDGFAAQLTSRELTEMAKKSGFIHAYPDHILTLQTTHSPRFLGLQQGSAGLWNESNLGRGVIIGVLDTGISPGHPSFTGKGMPPPPAKWKGTCEFRASLCNNKLIGARNLVEGAAEGPYDDNGHGTHTASTAAGAYVENASVNRLANGTAVGMAPLAHLAIYKVCSGEGCFLSDILAGMDAAVDDGVDVISISIGGGSQEFYNDAIAIGAFGAIERGVFVSSAAGNAGPFYYSVMNTAPWLLTVGASTIDRSIRATVKLGNKAEFNGESAYQPNGWNATLRPLVYPGSIRLNSSNTVCGNNSLDDIDVRGKIVLCDDGDIDWVEKGVNVKKAGGAGMIIANSDIGGFTLPATVHVLPASHVSYVDGLKIKSYIDSTDTPTSTIIFKGTILGTSPAPVVASFSGRGPSLVDPTILKPDIIGPGANILAAWTHPMKFNIISGTSMSTPHLSGITALLKSAHPDWSPAAVKSAIMTTAYTTTAYDNNLILDESHKPAELLDVGAGHVNPSKAGNPGLIYDISPEDYIAHLCGLGYSNRRVSVIARQTKVNCRLIRKKLNSELNYPSFFVTLSQTNFYNVTVWRTVTNVGAPRSKYTVQITPPKGVAVRVKPKKIVFLKYNQKLQYSVTLTGRGRSRRGSNNLQGHLTWVSSDNSIRVNSPIQVMLP